MKLVTVIGVRPKFITAATVSWVIATRDDITGILGHTGQHYEANISDLFSDKSSIPRPDHHLKPRGGSVRSVLIGRRGSFR